MVKLPLRVGLTGGIGSGKSTVAKMFEVLGVPVFYADTATKELMNSDPALRQHLIKAFGEQTYTGSVLNRAYLASVVFSNSEQLERLNALTHPAAIAAAEQWFAKQTAPYVIKEAALLFESGSSSGLDYIIGVSAPLNVRILRTIKRDNTTREQVLKRMDKQIEEGIKMKLCDFILINDEQQLLLTQVIEIHTKLVSINRFA